MDHLAPSFRHRYGTVWRGHFRGLDPVRGMGRGKLSVAPRPVRTAEAGTGQANIGTQHHQCHRRQQSGHCQRTQRHEASKDNQGDEQGTTPHHRMQSVQRKLPDRRIAHGFFALLTGLDPAAGNLHQLVDVLFHVLRIDVARKSHHQIAERVDDVNVVAW